MVIGGNGSYQGAHLLFEEFGARVVGIPGTIDNDVSGTETTIGFDTAVNTALQAIDRIRDTAFSTDQAFFVEVMGRHCGAIAIASALAGGAEEVLVPERPDEAARLTERLREGLVRGKRSLIVIVAEGDELGGAEAVAQRDGRDARHLDPGHRARTHPARRKPHRRRSHSREPHGGGRGRGAPARRDRRHDLRARRRDRHRAAS